MIVQLMRRSLLSSYSMLGCVMIQLLHFQLYIFNLGCSTFIFSTYHNFNFWIFNFSQNQPKCFQLWKFSTFCFFNFWQIQLFLFQLQPFSTYIISTSISVFNYRPVHPNVEFLCLQGVHIGVNKSVVLQFH